LIFTLPEEMKKALSTSRPFEELVKERFLQRYHEPELKTKI
jgi:hypothetical protein